MSLLSVIVSLNILILLILLRKLSKGSPSHSELEYKEREERAKEIALRLRESTYSIKLIRVSAADVLVCYQTKFIIGLEPGILENLVTCKWSLHGPHINVSDPELRQRLISPLLIDDVITRIPEGYLRAGQFVIGPNFGTVIRHLESMK